MKPLVMETQKFNDDDNTYTPTEVIIAPNYRNDYKASVKELEKAPIYFEINENHGDYMGFTTLTVDAFMELYEYMTSLKKELESAE